jgi:hypothetical protein
MAGHEDLSAVFDLMARPAASAEVRSTHRVYHQASPRKYPCRQEPRAIAGAEDAADAGKTSDFRQKGWGGVFCFKIRRKLLIPGCLVVGYLARFARLCTTFCQYPNPVCGGAVRLLSDR